MLRALFSLYPRMRYVAAYLLAALGGNENPEAKDIKKILESVGIEADDTRLDKVPYCVFGSCCGSIYISSLSFSLESSQIFPLNRSSLSLVGRT